MRMSKPFLFFFKVVISFIKLFCWYCSAELWFKKKMVPSVKPFDSIWKTRRRKRLQTKCVILKKNIQTTHTSSAACCPLVAKTHMLPPMKEIQSSRSVWSLHALCKILTGLFQHRSWGFQMWSYAFVSSVSFHAKWMRTEELNHIKLSITFCRHCKLTSLKWK